MTDEQRQKALDWADEKAYHAEQWLRDLMPFIRERKRELLIKELGDLQKRLIHLANEEIPALIREIDGTATWTDEEARQLRELWSERRDGIYSATALVGLAIDTKNADEVFQRIHAAENLLAAAKARLRNMIVRFMDSRKNGV